VNLEEKIAIVLVEPQTPGNVGMVCRAMKNMGLTDLRLVNGCRIDHPEAVKFAVSAKELLGSARRFPSLADALADRDISVATTRRHGKYRQEIMTPDQVATRLRGLLAENRAAIVFGREDSGLTTEEVSLCGWHATIPTGNEYGSLNLSQAVMVFCYELNRILGDVEPVPGRELAPSAETEDCFLQMEATLLKIGFLNPQNPDHLMRSLRRIFSRAELDSREVAIIRGMLTQVDWAAGGFQGRKGE
jgi:tRNA/rRNA methyltransferase